MVSRSVLRGCSAVAVGAVSTALLAVLAAPATAAPHVVQATYYAAPGGSGSACTSGAPCSLDGARDKVRTVNADMTGDIVVNLQGGTYALTSAFHLTEADSGSNGFDVIYRKDPAATSAPVLSGGQTVTGFTQIDATKNIYEASVPATLETRQLYVNGVRATRARSATNPAMTPSTTGYTLPTGGTYAGMASWGNVSDIEVAARFNWKWARYSVASISGTDMTIDAAGWNDGATQGAYAARAMTWIENAYELLDAPGEWYLNRTTHKLYYIPLTGQDVSTASFVAGSTVGLVDAAGTVTAPLRNVRLDGLTFAYDGWTEPSTTLGYPDFQGGAVYRSNPPGTVPSGSEPWSDNNYLTPAGVNFANVRDVAVTNSTFTHMANAALAFGPGSQDNLVDHNTFTDISGNGINLGGITKADHHPTNPATIVKDNVVSNNMISTVGAEYTDNVAIFLGYTQGSDVRHNTLHDLPYSGISMGWGWGYVDTLGTPVARNNVVRGNLIYDFMKTNLDGGAIYTLGSQLGSKVVDNYSYGDQNVYGYLYRDNGSAGFTDTNNVIDMTTSVNVWYRTNPSPAGYYAAHDNLSTGNFYTSGMVTAGTGGSNVVGTNTAVTGTRPAGAQAVVDNAGVNGADITPVTVGELPLSRGKTATASSTYATGPYDAAKAVDGDPASRWAQASGAADPSWLKVDLGDQYVISSVDTSAYLHLGKGMKYKVEYSTDDSTWSTYADKTAKFTVPGEDVNGSNPVARYVRITLTATQGQGGSLFEFDVFGKPVPPLSEGKIATASSTYATGSFGASQAVDGDLASRWAQASGAVDPSWLKVDLGAAHPISSVYTSAFPSGLAVKYKIEYSTDNSTWSTYVDKTAALSVPGLDTNPGSISARYLRITLTATQGHGGSLYEFQVYGS